MTISDWIKRLKNFPKDAELTLDLVRIEFDNKLVYLNEDGEEYEH